jgi:sirohydrochlorin ferrochelatase
LTTADAVLLLSHGSRDPRAAHIVSQLVAAVAERTGREVRAANLSFATPTPQVALRQLVCDGFRAVRVVPLLFTPGHHLTHDVPKAIEDSGVTEAMTVSVAPALLAGDGRQRNRLLMALADRLLQAGIDGHVDGLVLASAGSSSRRARTCIESLARGLELSHGVPVELAFASGGGPSSTQALEALSNKRIRRPAVASLFVAQGRLSDSVVAACPDVPVAAPLGQIPAFVELLVTQAQMMFASSSPHSSPTEMRALAGDRVDAADPRVKVHVQPREGARRPRSWRPANDRQPSTW